MPIIFRIIDMVFTTSLVIASLFAILSLVVQKLKAVGYPQLATYVLTWCVKHDNFMVSVEKQTLYVR